MLVFETGPLADDVEVTGAIEANLWISSDGPDTDFTIKLIDVYPPGEDYPEGFALNLTDGILRCRYRDSWENPTPLTGAPEGKGLTRRVARNTVYMDAGRPSHVVLPLIPNRA